MKTVKVEVDDRFGEEFRGLYEIRQVSQGEYEDTMLKFMDVAGHISRANLLRINRSVLWTSIVAQPSANPLSLDRVLRGDIPHGLAAKLQDAYDKVNGLQPDEQRFLSSQSDETSPTPESPSSPYAKSSDGPRTSTGELTEKASRSS